MIVYTIRCRVQGCRVSLVIHEMDLFVPNLMSWFSAAQMHILPGETFCDVGVGSGLHAIIAAKLGARRVYGTDISPTALRFARENARLNKVDRTCEFLVGSLLNPLIERGIRVDAIIYNAPQFPGRSINPNLPLRLRDSVNGGPEGGELNARFIRQAWKALRPHGRIYNPIVKWASPAMSHRAIRDGGYTAYEILRVEIPAWGRGNNMREWLVRNPGRHTFRFRYVRGPDTAARILELRKDDWAPVSAVKPRSVEVEFRITRLVSGRARNLTRRA